ncbi:MAG TPA: hypothetical protein P5556_07045 [Candidatus Gastranaerophilales bacterium]|nr:hypothetical protein [Candidatus Gastranaerophilales bacterium]
MESAKPNRLPKGVGKRIIETLRNQEFQTDYDVSVMPDLEEEKIETASSSPEEDEQDIYINNSYVQNEFESELECEPELCEETSEINYSCYVEPPVSPKKEKQTYETYQTQENYEKKEQGIQGISDIDTLLGLISKLPSGVTKQTGALIIRQTMEAIGISMNKVLGDAQSVQEELEYNIKHNINIIEEYRTKIKILEQEILKYKKKAHELEDIISLFILSE